MHRSQIIVDRLVVPVHSATDFYANASARSVRPWLTPFLARLASMHRWVETELRGEAVADADAAPGSAASGWRRAWREWRVRNHFDSDLLRVERARTCELKLARRFDRALRRVPQGDLHRRVAVGLREIDRARLDLARMVGRIRDDIDARRLEAYRRTPPGVAASGAGRVRRGEGPQTRQEQGA